MRPILYLSFALLTACASNNGAPPPTRLEASTPVEAPPTPVQTPGDSAQAPEGATPRSPRPVAQTCSSDADCKATDDYCGGCDCRALAKDSSLPACGGNTVSCFMAPCRDKRPVCQNGSCALANKPSSSEM